MRFFTGRVKTSLEAVSDHCHSIKEQRKVNRFNWQDCPILEKLKILRRMCVTMPNRLESEKVMALVIASASF